MSRSLPRKVTRRRFMRIAAATASCAATGVVGTSALADGAPVPTVWRGVAMGNVASIEIRHADPIKTRRLLDTVRTEIARLESVLSLYRPDSALSMLNRDRILHRPSLDLVQVLSEAQRFGALTQGRFDVTVQPLWKVYAEHFAQPGCDPAGPGPALVDRAAECVDYAALEIEPTVVGFGKSGMAATLNGIAQGYITDRVVAVLRNEGLDHALVDLGEIRAIGGGDAQGSWRAGIENPLDRGSVVDDVPLLGNALATSGGYGFQFDTAGRFHHIFDPATGDCPHRYASVSVVAPNAMTADALATAGNLLAPDAFERALKAAGAQRALLVGFDGSRQWVVV